MSNYEALPADSQDDTGMQVLRPPQHLVAAAATICTALSCVLAWFVWSWSTPEHFAWLLWGSPKPDTFLFDALRAILQLSTQLPYWCILIMAFVKPPMVGKFVGGPGAPRPGENTAAFVKRRGDRSLISRANNAVVILLSACALLTDVKRVAKAVSLDVAWWQRFIAGAFAISLSTNFTTMYALGGLRLLYRYVQNEKLVEDGAREVWDVESYFQDALGLPVQRPEQEETLLLAIKGKVFFHYALILQAIYGPLLKILGLLLLPGVAVYFWIIGPLYCALKEIVKRTLPTLASKLQLSGGIVNFPTEREFDAAARESLLKKGQIESIDDNHCPKWLVAEEKIYLSTGISHDGWVSYFKFPIVAGVMLPFFGPVVCRLYAGNGIMGSLVETLTDRHVDAYAGHLITTVATPMITLMTML